MGLPHEPDLCHLTRALAPKATAANLNIPPCLWHAPIGVRPCTAALTLSQVVNSPDALIVAHVPVVVRVVAVLRPIHWRALRRQLALPA